MRFQNLLFILIISITFAGCSSCEDAPKNGNTNQAVVKTNNNDKTDNSAKPDDSKTENNSNDNAPKINDENSMGEGVQLAEPRPQQQVEAVTLKPVVMAFCDALRKKDDAALEKLYSRKSLQSIKADMKTEGTNSISEYFESEPVGNKCEVKNEEIKGNTATAYVITQTYPQGTQFRFVKENNEWKLTNESASIDRVEQN